MKIKSNNSRWWSDVVGQEIENAGSSLTRSVFEAAKTRGISLDLWETAEALLNEFL
jgi:hypothetical protein